MAQENKCFDCGAEFKPDGCTTGYGTDNDNHRICFACCGNRDLKDMIKTGRATLYLIKVTSNPNTEKQTWGPQKIEYKITNWPNSLSFIPTRVKIGRHNIARTRTDVWFNLIEAKEQWHGVTYGDNTQICHCKRIKE